MDKKISPDRLALIISGNEARTLVPAMLQAFREPIEKKRHEKTLAIFRMIDTKASEFDIFQKCLAEAVTEKIVVGKKDGIDVVANRYTKSRLISWLAKNMGRGEMAEIIRMLLVNVNNYFNLKEGLNEYQVDEIVEQIIDEVGDKLFIDELVYVFKKAKTTAQLYSRLDGSMIFKWIDDHIANRVRNRDTKDAERKADNFIIPVQPNTLLPKAYEKMRAGYTDTFKNMNDEIDRTSPDKPKKKKKKD